MTDLDTLIREFRAPLDEPAPGAQQRIVRRIAPARRRWRPRVSAPRLAIGLATVVAVCAVGALAPWDGGRGGDATASLLARAEAAVVARDIVQLRIRIHSTTTEPSVVPEDRDRAITMHQWTLAGAGDAMQARVLISEGRDDQPPTDEDSTTVVARDGSIADTRSWTPGGELSVATAAARRAMSREIATAGGSAALTLTGMLRHAYRERSLHVAGRTSDGLLRLTADGPILGGTTLCTSTEVLLDPTDFMPRRIDIVSRAGENPQACDPSAPVVNHERWTIAARVLPADDANRRLLQLGDWPIDRIVADDRDFETNDPTLDDTPPVPPLDEG